ncbi:MAG: glycosyltransferase family 4 protein [Verrucomicrobiota bacterium]
MKIGLFIPNATFDLPGSPEVGGIEVFAFELGEAMMRLGHEVILFGGEPKAGRRHRTTTMKLELAPYIETQRIWKLGSRFRKLVQRLAFGQAIFPKIQEANLDLMVVFKPYDFINAFRWRKLAFKVVMNYQGKDFFPTDRFWRRWIHGEFACSDENAALARERYGVLAPTYSNAVETDFFKPAEESEIQSKDRFRILTVGRMVGWKGLPTLISVLEKMPKIEWWAAGDGPEREKLLTLAKEAGVENRFKACGVLEGEKLREVMQRADVMVQPSWDFDACPTAVLQGMSCGLPLVLSDQVGLKSLIQNQEAFQVSVARDPDSIVYAIEKWMKDPVARLAAAKASRKEALTRFSWARLAKSLEAEWLRLIAE